MRCRGRRGRSAPAGRGRHAAAPASHAAAGRARPYCHIGYEPPRCWRKWARTFDAHNALIMVQAEYETEDKKKDTITLAEGLVAMSDTIRIPIEHRDAMKKKGLK